MELHPSAYKHTLVTKVLSPGHTLFELVTSFRYFRSSLLILSLSTGWAFTSGTESWKFHSWFLRLKNFPPKFGSWRKVCFGWRPLASFLPFARPSLSSPRKYAPLSRISFSLLNRVRSMLPSIYIGRVSAGWVALMWCSVNGVSQCRLQRDG